jgi:3-hydroxyacyl-CoA dehydrogenase/enoyl-CoA hydratase/3-hydroxybutyryl-CoA epimerase
MNAAPSAPTVPREAARTIRREMRSDGICVLTLDRPGSSANFLDRLALGELADELGFVESSAEVRGVIFVSAKRSIFVAGADLNSMRPESPPAVWRELIEFGQNVMNRVSALRVPTVAAVHGAAMGGGYELALACDWRIATDDRATRIGLPETQLGLLPAWGGSTRLPRLIGLAKALDIITAGKTLKAAQAFELGMVDELVPVSSLLEASAKRITAGKPHREERSRPGAESATTAARYYKELEARTRGNYPAPLKALDVVTRGLDLSIPKSLELEREGIFELLGGEPCHNLVRGFFLQERAKKLSVPSGTKGASPSPPIKCVAVIGAGVMGAGIAQWLSSRGLSVTLSDINEEQTSKGMARVAKVFDDGVKRGIYSADEAREGKARVQTGTASNPATGVDLVIEAAIEDLEAKKAIFHRLGSMPPNTILATNTSALPVSELAAVVPNPERVVGIHFFNPVNRMQLIEIGAAHRTSAEVLQAAVRFAQQVGKLPVLVQDSPGFIVNRILIPYLAEAVALFESGAEVADLEESMLDFGMPMGPLRLLDEVGLDVALNIVRSLAGRFGDHVKVPESLAALTGAGFLGRKCGSGFFDYAGPVPAPSPHAAELARHPTGRAMKRPELQQRMVLAMVNEAARCLDEKVAANPGDVDFAMITGAGFAPFRGGPLRYADSIGLSKVCAAMRDLADHGATHLAPCGSLQQLAAESGRFYSNSGESNEHNKPET